LVLLTLLPLCAQNITIEPNGTTSLPSQQLKSGFFTAQTKANSNFNSNSAWYKMLVLNN